MPAPDVGYGLWAVYRAGGGRLQAIQLSPKRSRDAGPWDVESGRADPAADRLRLRRKDAAAGRLRAALVTAPFVSGLMAAASAAIQAEYRWLRITPAFDR